MDAEADEPPEPGTEAALALAVERMMKKHQPQPR
jgi:hypothetical protein